MLDDGEEFDWVAAVAEIDAACDKAIKQSSVPTSSSSRQLTLDRFIHKETKYEENAAADASLCNHQVDTEKYEEAADASLYNHQIDPEAAQTWIYPESPPVRDYQLSITKTALFANTLVSLPTGLGKTLIAAVVIYNYSRWFPKGKIVFTAPSRPLVTQQIQACHNIVGISQERTVDLTGQTTPSKRASLWKDKQIFFVTPQVLEKDIQSGTCPVTQLVCLVIDEAHHASGNYSYCVAVRELMAIPVHLRILALTATPGGNHQTVQQVIDNLQISVLEYRSESHPDVISYVHDRKVELIEVEMGKEAAEVNKLIMDVIHVHAKKLNDIGVLQRRDPQTMSPMDFINSREKFRQFPPQNRAEINYGEVEGSFAILITLYHIRKLVAAHGIRPAFEMLEEKLKQGYFARLLSRNEKIHKAKVIMQQNLSHGSYSPKFSKLLEVLVEHFEKHDSQKSRVIIFSHFRESVRDIMSTLANIGEHVKATEFVGQNSGKTSKGQSQKVQQAVLQKFRDGGYNVIVATSIGEEGLDIMEVDLVICFDANISPLRMIQRMGRTGRKSKGRVACEGIELTGYKRKQAKGKAVDKHMLNAGKSFSFHPSSRMVPHVFRPEIKLVKFSIEEFVPRGKKVKEDDANQTPRYKPQLTDIETNLLEKYFDPAREDNWGPSLIAFPHFQAFPSRVHEIAHSSRTTMLIGTMQYLQGLSFNGQDEDTSEECFKVETCNGNTREDELVRRESEYIQSVNDVAENEFARQEPEAETKEKHHSFYFGSDFAAVDSNGSILILSVPVFRLKQFSPIKTSIPQNITSKYNEEITLDVGVNEDDRTFQVNIPNEDEAGDLSPRLTNLVMSGVVPESPIHNRTSNTAKGCYTTLGPDITSVSLVQSKNNEVVTPKQEIRITQVNNSIEKCSKFVGEIRTPLSNLSNKSCSKDWILSSGEKSVSQPKKKLKRLRKFCDINSEKEDNPSVSGSRSCPPLDHGFDKHGRGGRKLSTDARVFIDDEAEDSTEASDDEEFDNGEDSYGGSFIDDRINPTMATASPFDMMAIYRRSLLTQSPIIDSSLNKMGPMDEADDDRTPSPFLHTNADSSSHLNTSRLFSDTNVIPSTTNGPANDAKRQKLTDCGPLPICNLEKEMFLDPEANARQVDAFDDDDEFYQGIDFDALEEQASKQLKAKSSSSNEKPKIKDLEFLDSPSFDLGI